MNNNVIIGPPGTGKTYRAKKEIVSTIWNSLDDTEKKGIENRYYNPVNFCEKAFNHVMKDYKVGNCQGIYMVSMHEGMLPSDFIKGISIQEADGHTSLTEEIRPLLSLIHEAERVPEKPAFILLDDIHRVNIRSALGELLYAFIHRNESVTTSSGVIINVPENVYVFMTYNNLRPDYKIDSQILGSFTSEYTENTKDILRRAIEDNFYKSVYFSVDEKLITKLYKNASDWKGLNEKIRESSDFKDKIYEISRSVPDFLTCNKEDADKFVGIKFPLTWINSNINIKGKKEFNKIGKDFYECINEIYDEFSQYYNYTTVQQLQPFIDKAVKDYSDYNGIIKDSIAPEYNEEQDNYKIGFSYFVPSDSFTMENADQLLQNKIRAQVQPLLRQYRQEGVILSDDLPDIERTATRFTRDWSQVTEEKIKVSLDNDFRNEFLRSYNNRKSITEKRNGGQKFNANYCVLFEIVNDMIEHPLINHWEIMDLLVRDREVYYKLEKNKKWGGCLLCNSRVSSLIRTGENDQTSGNNNGVYSEKFHSFVYKGHKYYMVSKIKTEDAPKTAKIEKCKTKKPGGREKSLYYMVKILVWKYLKRYMKNLELYKNELKDSSAKTKLDDEINAVKGDIQKIEDLKFHLEPQYGKDDEPRWNLLKDIRELQTWQDMINSKIKGVYKIMDKRYQSIMDSTGIHQMILQGPPGTSKTYGAKHFIAGQARLLDLSDEWDNKELSALQLKTENDEYVLPEDSDIKSVFWDIIQFHPSYTYEDFVRGISVETTDGKTVKVNGKITDNGADKYSIEMDEPVSVRYKTVNRTIGKMASIARKYYDPDNQDNCKKFYLIIDEVNRANLATVFGELIYALEYRDSEVATPYSIGNDSHLSIPSNLYIVGTMNTADKSISSIDYAIRRRFLFFPVLPDIMAVYRSVRDDWDKSKNADELRLFYIVDRLFDLYMNNDDYSRNDVQVGHTYFIRKKNGDNAEDLKNRFLYQVLPVLREYINDGILDLDRDVEDENDYEQNAFKKLKDMVLCEDNSKSDVLYADLLKELHSDEITKAVQDIIDKRKA